MHTQIQTITSFIKSTLQKAGKSRLVIGVSGGIDSALSLTLATHAIGKENVYPLLLPYGDQDILDCMEICRFNQIPADNIKVLNIQESVDQIVQTISNNCHSRESMSPAQNQTQRIDSEIGSQPTQTDNINVRLGNIMARVRMIILFDQAKKLDALVCGTENKSEHYLGYFTRFGDSASDLEPISHLYKTQVFELAKELGIPKQFMDKAPSAGLWNGQTDEQELGFSYKDADLVLAQLIDQGKKPEEIEVEGIEKKVIEKIIQQVKSQAFKMEVPYHLKVYF